MRRVSAVHPLAHTRLKNPLANVHGRPLRFGHAVGLTVCGVTCTSARFLVCKRLVDAVVAVAVAAVVCRRHKRHQKLGSGAKYGGFRAVLVENRDEVLLGDGQNVFLDSLFDLAPV
jgi:hypothetical protein